MSSGEEITIYGEPNLGGSNGGWLRYSCGRGLPHTQDQFTDVLPVEE
jgi:hypothetical protein